MKYYVICHPNNCFMIDFSRWLWEQELHRTTSTWKSLYQQLEFWEQKSTMLVKEAQLISYA